MFKVKLFSLFFLLISEFLLFNIGESAQIPEKPGSQQYLFDFANIIQEQKETIIPMLKNYHETIGIEFVVVTVSDLQRETINDFAEQLFQQWKIGKSSEEKGLLLLLAKKELLVKMEVAYELEDVFTDAFCGYIEREQLLPYLESGRVGMGLQGTIEAVVNQTWEKIDSGILILSEERRYKLGIKSKAISGGAGAKEDISIATGQRKYTPIREPFRTRYQAQESPELAFQRFVEILEKYIDDPTLEIYTEGTRIQFNDAPSRNTFQFNTFLKQVKDGYPYKIIVEGDRAVVKFRENATRSNPLLFKRSNKGWQFDEATMWRLFWFDYNNDWYMKSRDHDYMFAFGERIKEDNYNDEQFKIEREYKDTLREEIVHYKNKIRDEPDNYVPYFQLGDLYFDDCFKWRNALSLYEQGIKHISDSEIKAHMHFYAGSRYMYCSRYQNAIKHYQEYIQYAPNDFYGYYRIGYCYLQLRNGKEAIKFYKKSLQYKEGSKNMSSISGLGYAYAMMKDFRQAMKYLSEYKKLGANQERVNKLKSFIESQKR